MIVVKISKARSVWHSVFKVMVIFVDQHREQYGVEPICEQIGTAPSSYYEHKARTRNSDRLPERIKRGMKLELDIQRNLQIYGTRKVWWQLLRECIDVARCTIERLMKKIEIQGTRHQARQEVLDGRCG